MRKTTAFFLLCLYTTIVYATPAVWRPVIADALPSKKDQVVHPNKFTVHQIDEAQVKSQLFGLSEDPGRAAVFVLPMPDGKLRQFRVWQAPMMEPGLAAKFPEIKTFTAVAIDNQHVTAKLDFTVLGFHAIVFDANDTWFVDPFTKPSNGYYLSYYKKDIIASTNNASCQVNDEQQVIKEEPVYLTKTPLPLQADLKVNGSAKRSYRLALACTGEYSKAVAYPASPSVVVSLSAMTTTINRVNGVFERELGMHLDLVANNNLLVYTDFTTDPFTFNNNTVQLRYENQSNTDNVIGSGSYDIGHIFASSIGGAAERSSVCITGVKAQTATGQPDPVGDAFDIDFVIHEMGHQFGATHTYNANTASCLGKGIAATAYEPGSGSSIMGYAGICSAVNDLQPHSDDYFHAASLDQISDYISDPTTGGSCAVTSASGNTPATVPAFSQSYTIPYLTPFELIAPIASDADHDTLTYNWEEYDLGDFKLSFNDTKTNGPIFRSFKQTPSPVRVFPTLDKLLQNQTNYLGEKLPEVTRSLKFKLTVRDIYNGWGCYNTPSDSIVLNVVDAAGPFSVSFPSAITDYWQSGTSASVTWNVANTDKAPVNCSNVDIMLSVDRGLTFPYMLAANTPNDGNETINVPPNIYAEGCRVKIKSVGNVFLDISNENFSIFPWPAGIKNAVDNEAMTIYPVPVKDVLHIDLKDSGNYHLVITDVTSRKVYTSKAAKQNAIATSGWASGVYCVSLTDAESEKRILQKVVVQ